MNIVKRASCFVTRNWKKSAILFILLFIVSNLIISSVLILHTIDQTREYFYTRMPNQVFVSYRYRWEGEELSGISLETLDAIRELPYVRNHRPGVGGAVSSRVLLPFYEEGMRHLNTAGSSHCLNFGLCRFAFHGISETSILEIDEGIFALTAGRLFSPEEIETLHPVAIVPHAFAELNGLTVGDIMSFEIMVHDVSAFDFRSNPLDYVLDTFPIEIEIIGLFEMNHSVTEVYQNTIITQAYNIFFTPIAMVAHINEMTSNLLHQHFTEEELEEMQSIAQIIIDSGAVITSFFTLYDSRDYDAFYEQAMELSQMSVAITALDIFGIDDVSNSMTRMQDAMIPFLYASIIGCCLIIVITFVLFFKNRRYEMGVYMILGEAKSQLVKQLLIEALFVTIPVLLFSFFTANFLTARINVWMLGNHLAIDRHLVRNMLWTYVNSITTDHVYAVHQTSLDVYSILITFGTLILTTLLTTLIPIIYLLFLKPKRNLDFW